ncbi:TPA: hypothetical protein P0E36_004909 [Vibrio harveyi]|nr:hypothetical protein [Vibrio harveyi]
MKLPAEFKPKTEIQEMMESLGCTGDRVKPQDIVDRIVDIEFKTIELCGNKFMYCGIAMKGNNQERPFVVAGKPATCIDPDNWRDEIGQQVCFNNSFEEIYKLEAYRKMTAPKLPEHAPARDGFKLYEGKPVVREAYQLTKRDLITMTIIGDGKKASIQIEGSIIEFAFHCSMNEIKAGDYVVFLNADDTYHCSEEVFNERNVVN